MFVCVLSCDVSAMEVPGKYSGALAGALEQLQVAELQCRRTELRRNHFLDDQLIKETIDAALAAFSEQQSPDIRQAALELFLEWFNCQATPEKVINQKSVQFILTQFRQVQNYPSSNFIDVIVEIARRASEKVNDLEICGAGLFLFRTLLCCDISGVLDAAKFAAARATRSENCMVVNCGEVLQKIIASYELRRQQPIESGQRRQRD